MPAVATASHPRIQRSPHQLESDVRRALLSEAEIDVISLVVRRLANGVYLEGVIHVNGDDVDVCRAVRDLEGVGEVYNHLLVCWNCPDPEAPPVDEVMF